MAHVITAKTAKTAKTSGTERPRLPFDPDFGKTGFPRRLLRLRFRRLKLTQRQFCDRFGFRLGMLKDLEQGRVKPLPATRLLIAVIELDPALVDRAVLIAGDDSRSVG